MRKSRYGSRTGTKNQRAQPHLPVTKIDSGRIQHHDPAARRRCRGAGPGEAPGTSARAGQPSTEEIGLPDTSRRSARVAPSFSLPYSSAQQPMQEVPKRIKRLVRDWAGIAHDRDLRKALSELRMQFNRW